MENWEPAQVKPQPVLDLRGAALGPRGFKLRNQHKQSSLGEQGAARLDTMEVDDKEHVSLPSIVPDQSHDTTTLRNVAGLGKKSGRSWRAPACRSSKATRASRSMGLKAEDRLSMERVAFKERRKGQAELSILKQRKQKAVEEYKDKLKIKRQQVEAANKRKEENRKKSMVTQEITNPATLRKLMKSKKGQKQIVKR